MNGPRVRTLIGWAVAAVVAGELAIPNAGASPLRTAAGNEINASSPLTWSAPALIDHQPPFGHPPGLGGISCPTSTFCVSVGWAGDGVGNVATSTNPTGGTDAWKVVYHVDDSNLISDVSCPTTTLCVAIDWGNVITATDPTGGVAAWTITSVDDRRLNAISCPTTTLCVGVDDQGNVLTSTNPTGGAVAWTKSNVDGTHPLSAISCPTASLCVATDIWGNVISTSDPTAGAAWTVVNVAATRSLQAVSCPSASLCVVADDSGDVITSTSPTGGSDAWNTTYVGGSTSSYDAAVTCPATTLCIVTDRDGHIFTSTNPTGGAAAWTASNVALYSLSCPSVSLCVAVSDASVGTITTSTNPTGGSSAWISAPLGVSGIAGVSCPSSVLCVAVDDGGNVLASTSPSRGTWTFGHVDGAALSPNAFTAVSCPSASFCVAVDDVGNALTSTNPTGAGTWAAANVDGTHRLWSVSCPSASLCIAGDGVGNVVTSTNPTGGAGAWTVTHVDNAPAGLNYLSGMSCPSVSLCVAVDGAGNVLMSTNPAGGAGTWSPVYAAGAGLAAVSCPSTSLCVAVGLAGTLVTMTGTGNAVYTVDSSRRLTSVSCVSSLCVAGDIAGQVVTSTEPTGGAAAWAPTAIDPSGAISAVSCPSELLCITGDTVGNAVIGTLVQHSLTVSKTGSGSGTVTSTDGQISCGATCSHAYSSGTLVTLNAAPASGSSFAGWSGACSGTGSCQVTMSSAQTVTATFSALAPSNLTRPAITGTARLGKTLTCSNGTWRWSPTSYTRLWYRNGAAITGATASTHLVVSADLQRRLTCAVTAHNAGGSSAPAVSAAVVVQATTVLTERETTRAGATRACGASVSTACRDRRYATVYFGGKATPVPIPAATRSVTVRFYYRSGGVWRLKATVTVRASSSNGAWRLAKTGVTSTRGAWRVRATVAGTSTLTSANSVYRYYQVY
ncbi:MAG TPA: hypothetical protein VFH66_03750 [Mycobacteriales bacterium]|nr:hypothetical protein [Mycobacteriales bacterium]